VPVYGCGFLQENSVWIERGSFDALDEAGRRAWQERCDPSQYVPHVTMPLLFVTRPTDVHYRLDSLRKTYRLVPPELLHLAVRVGLGHSHPHGWAPPEIGRFADHAFRGAPPLPRLGEPALSADRTSVQTTVRSVVPLTQVALAYTADEGPWQEREWRHAPADVGAGGVDGASGADGTVVAEVPRGTTACFFALTDERGGYASSPHVEVGGAAATGVASG
jgi:hypothetical protein